MQDLDKPWLLHAIWECSKKPHKMKFKTRDPDVLYNFAWPKMLKHYFAKNSQYNASKNQARQTKWRAIFESIDQDDWKYAIEARATRPATKMSSCHGKMLIKAESNKKRGKREHSSVEEDEEEENDSEGDSNHATPKKRSKTNTKEKPAEVYPAVMLTKLEVWAEKCGFDLAKLRPLQKLTVEAFKTQPVTLWLEMFEEFGLTHEMLNNIDIEIQSARKLYSVDSLHDSILHFLSNLVKDARLEAKAEKLHSEREQLKRDYDENDAILAARIEKAMLGIDSSDEEREDNDERIVDCND